MNHVAKKQRGFTIIELMLAMSFISVLLIAIALTIVQIGNIYNKGLTTKEINQTGRDITDDLKRTLSVGTTVDISDDFVEVKNGTRVVNGRLCLGSVSYVWNTAWAIDTDQSALLRSGGEVVRFMKVQDATKAYCAKNPVGGAPVATAVTGTNVRELLREGDRSLALHGLKITSGAAAIDPTTQQRLYRINFTLGTDRTELINIDATPMACKSPAEIGNDLMYCTVQDFSIVVRAGSGV